jgi:hypothetical protein
MTRPIVVAFTGKRGSGKSEAARVLVSKLGFRELKFADPLKNMLRAMYATCGVDAETVERKLEGDLKEVPCDWLMGKTPRFAMQTLGTEWRDMINTQLWSEMFKKAVLSGNLGERIVCSDYRFKHEGAILDELGAVKYRIVRPTANAVSDEASKHASETEIDNIPTDFDIINDRDIGDLQVAVLDLVIDGMQISGINVFPTRWPEGGCMDSTNHHPVGTLNDREAVVMRSG